LPRRKAREISKEATKVVRNKPPHELLIPIIDDAVEEERVALGKSGWRQLGGPLRREHKPEAELPTFPSDLLKRFPA